MSRSPWKFLDRAIGDLEDFEALLARFPDADARVREALGDEGLARLKAMLPELRIAAARLRATDSPTSGGG